MLLFSSPPRLVFQAGIRRYTDIIYVFSVCLHAFIHKAVKAASDRSVLSNGLYG
ncbi:MAG: hypothetical protein ACOYJX_06045 [Acutalibacteraceae bacterium]